LAGEGRGGRPPPLVKEGKEKDWRCEKGEGLLERALGASSTRERSLISDEAASVNRGFSLGEIRS